VPQVIQNWAVDWYLEKLWQKVLCKVSINGINN
jgi:hypothetical protein